MNFSFSLTSLPLSVLKRFLYREERLDESSNFFSIKLNGFEFSIPIELAFCYSNTIKELLNKDYSIRNLEINIEFNNEENKQKIIDILTDNENLEFELTDINDIIDFALFGTKFGNETFAKPFKEYINSNFLNINSSNADFFFKTVHLFLGLPNRSTIFKIIAKNFYIFDMNPDFISWCCQEGNEKKC